MGWANCGIDSKGRHIGYAFPTICDHPGCNERIDRGLVYACGGMHGEVEHGCEGYFCETHRAALVSDGRRRVLVCGACHGELLASGDWEDRDGVLVRVLSRGGAEA